MNPDIYSEFLRIVRAIVDHQIANLEHDAELMASANEFATCVWNTIDNNEARQMVVNAIDQQPPIVADALIAELNFFNLRFANNAAQNNPDAFAAAETVKSSLEKVLDLPDWLEKMLKILNELLSLLGSN